jgi:hypothetical protein
MNTLLLIIAIVVAGYLVARAIAEMSQRNAAIELERIRNSIEYRTQVSALRDFLDFKDNYRLELLEMRREEVELSKGSLPKSKQAFLTCLEILPMEFLQIFDIEAGAVLAEMRSAT